MKKKAIFSIAVAVALTLSLIPKVKAAFYTTDPVGSFYWGTTCSNGPIDSYTLCETTNTGRQCTIGLSSGSPHPAFVHYRNGLPSMECVTPLYLPFWVP